MKTIELSVADMLSASGGEWLGDPALLQSRPANIVTDSRDASPGCLFIALKGERTDGHRYIPDVLSRGALAVLCSEGGLPGEPRIVTDDVMEALRRIAQYNRSRLSCPFIGVTGSVGKTTAKEMTASVLSARFETFRTPGSLNGQVGLPVTLMQLRSGLEAAVVEMGVSLFGEMHRLSELVRPDHVVFTNIGDAHLEAFHDREGILLEKSHILDFMHPGGTVFVNGDDPLLSSASFNRRTVRFGIGDHCDVRADEVSQTGNENLSCRIIAGKESFPVHVPAYGTYMIYSVLAAAAVGMELGMTPDEIADGLSRYKTVGHRSRVVNTPRCTLIDDCYNANPTSNRAAIESMLSFPGRKVCILGDMREMGEASEAVHREIGRYAADNGVSLLLTYGNEARYISEGAGDIAIHYEDRSELLSDLKNRIFQGDVVLVKASHGPNFVDVVAEIEALGV